MTTTTHAQEQTTGAPAPAHPRTRRATTEFEVTGPSVTGWWSPIYPMLSGIGEPTVLLVQPHADTARALAAYLRAHWPEATLVAVPDPAQAMAIVETETVHAIAIDLDLPEMEGFALLEAIRNTCDVPTIACANGDFRMLGVRALEMGADVCLGKPFKPAEFLASVKALLRRTAIAQMQGAHHPGPTDPAVVIDTLSHEVRIAGKLVTLNPTEFDVLAYLARNEGRVVPHRTLLMNIWGPAYGDDIHVLRVNINRIRQKLANAGLTHRIIDTVWAVGYKFNRPRHLPATSSPSPS